MNRFRSILQWLRLEEDGEVSITSAFCWASLLLFILTTLHQGQLDFVGVVSLLPAIGLYSHKRILGAQASASAEEQAAAAEKQAAAAQALSEAVEKANASHDLATELVARVTALDNRTRPR